MLFTLCLVLLVIWLIIQLWDWIVAMLMLAAALMLAGGVVVALIIFLMAR